MVSSVLLKNIKTLKNSLKESISYVDLNYKGIDSDGSVTVDNEKAVGDRYRLWLQTGTYDYHRNPNFGGFMEEYVIKRPLSEDNARYIETMLRSETHAKFPEIELVDCKVTPNFSQRRWEIKVSVLDKRTGVLDESMLGDNGTTIVQTV